MTCIIVDDEPIARQGLLSFAAKVPALIVKGMFKNTREAQDYIEKNPVDLILLDIQMPGISGMAFARSVPKKTFIIFTTAHPQYALESYEIDALDYLVKPIRQERFLKAVNKAIEYYFFLSDDFKKSKPVALEENRITIKADRRLYKILHNDISHIEGMKDYSIVFTKDTKIITAMNLKTIHSHLPEATFKRISKSYIVNKKQVTSVASNTVYINETELPLGNTYRKAFMESF